MPTGQPYGDIFLIVAILACMKLEKQDKTKQDRQCVLEACSWGLDDQNSDPSLNIYRV